MVKEQKHVICRACHASCGLIVDFEDGAPVATHGDKNNPVFFGYSCIKGRRLADYHTLPTRLLQSQKRLDDGSFQPISWRDAASESAEKIKAIIDRDGPNAVAAYVGTFGYCNFASHAFTIALLEAIESKMYFTSVTIDQPGKAISGAEHGRWLAGAYRITDWDGLMLVGTNPIISQNGGLGSNPARNLHKAKKRGMELIVVDPRRTDCAEKADLHIQGRPGEDVAVLAAITRQLIEDNALDKEFIKNEVSGLDALKKAVGPFDPRSAGERAGVSPDDIVKGAWMIAGWRRGQVSVGTGPNMSGFGNLVEYLSLVLPTLRGHWMREGDIRRNEGFFIKPADAVAAATGPYPSYGYGKELRTRNLGETLNGMPTGALADEIITPGDGQIKALIVVGGNPMLAWPDQLRTLEAMQKLELLICIDPRMSKTAEMADYVIAPKLHYEMLGTTALLEMTANFGAGGGFDETYGQVSQPILQAPTGSDLCEDFEFLRAIATELEKPLSIRSWALLNHPEEAEAMRTEIKPGTELDPVSALSAALNGAPVSVEEALADPDAHKGVILERQGEKIRPKPADWQGKLEVGSPLMMEELHRYALRRLNAPIADDNYPYRLISRRLNAIHNSNWHEEPGLRHGVRHHPAYINPEDLKALHLKEGDVVEIESARASIKCVAHAAPDVRVGCLSVPHAWGTNPDEDDDPLGAGGNTGRLTDSGMNYDKITGIPIMSAIPVRLRAVSVQ